MSALGQKQTYAPHNAMSALPPIATAKADIHVGSARPARALHRTRGAVKWVNTEDGRIASPIVGSGCPLKRLQSAHKPPQNVPSRARVTARAFGFAPARSARLSYDAPLFRLDGRWYYFMGFPNF